MVNGGATMIDDLEDHASIAASVLAASFVIVACVGVLVALIVGIAVWVFR
jgi:hypothetical protein